MYEFPMEIQWIPMDFHRFPKEIYGISSKSIEIHRELMDPLWISARPPTQSASLPASENQLKSVLTVSKGFKDF